MNIVLTGAKGSSKSTMEKLLTSDTIKMNKVISYTTRKPRNGEVDGVDYHFLTKDEFYSIEANNNFAEIVSYNNNDYGILESDLLNDKDNVIVVEIAGLKQILNNIPREELFIVKMDCSINEQIQRILNRDKLEDYDEIVELIQTLKFDRKYFSQNYPYDFYIDTTNMHIDDVLCEILRAFGKYSMEIKRNEV